MGMQTPLTQKFTLPDGREVTLETGKLATQAHGSALVRLGNTMILATAVSNKEAREGQPFFPLSVDYQEKYAAVGRIPGNFFRRETRLSDYEVLISRLVDRAIRPLFPDGYMNETQIIINLISADEEVLPDAMAALAVSTALSVSDIPWAGPISEVRVALIDGEYKVNPLKIDLERAVLNVIVAASIKDVMMVEGEAQECSEEELVEAIRVGHEAIKVQCQAQLDLAKQVGDKALIKREIEVKEEDEELMKYVSDFARDRIYTIAKGALDKSTRREQFQQVSEDLKADLEEKKGEEFEKYMEEKGALVSDYFDKLKKEVIRTMVLDEKVRLDGRKLDEVRPIWSEVDYLPSAHGSAVFNRGETQALTSLTLGTKQDEILIDNALDIRYEKFILHYNFPAFSVGEVKPQRGPGRREVGHANLAARSLKQVIPSDLPYTLRIVSDVLESNGSSSLATVCAGSLSLMDAGVQIPGHVSGIAMGLIVDKGKSAILSDILGDEDALGDMDFKVSGTENGITGCQMDMKIDGLPYELLKDALDQAKKGRLHIINEMSKAIELPRPDLKPHTPRVIELIIEKSFIGAVIGPGGKIIQEMQEVTGTTISIDEVNGKGIVNIYGKDQRGVEAAVERIKFITHMPEIGDVYEGKVATVMPYGVFVDFMGKSGLLHISEVSHTRIDKIEDVFQEGDPVKIKLVDIDKKTGKYRLSRKALMPRPPRTSDDTEITESRDDRSDNRDRSRNRDRSDNRDRSQNRDRSDKKDN